MIPSVAKSIQTVKKIEDSILLTKFGRYAVFHLPNRHKFYSDPE
jgi:hypothetical protein